MFYRTYITCTYKNTLYKLLHILIFNSIRITIVVYYSIINFYLSLILFSLVDEDCYPWKGTNMQCKLRKRTDLKTAGCRPPTNPLRTELYKVGPAYRLGNETDIMYEILTSGPVQGKLSFFFFYFTYFL